MKLSLNSLKLLNVYENIYVRLPNNLLTRLLLPVDNFFQMTSTVENLTINRLPNHNLRQMFNHKLFQYSNVIKADNVSISECLPRAKKGT